MSAEIIDLRAWRQEHRETQEPETRLISVPFLLPTWPWGWLQPVLLEVAVGIVEDAQEPPRKFAAQSAGRFAHEAWPSLHPGRERGDSPATPRLFLVASSRGDEACDL
jgi:hypothetical protein